MIIEKLELEKLEIKLEKLEVETSAWNLDSGQWIEMSFSMKTELVYYTTNLVWKNNDITTCSDSITV